MSGVASGSPVSAANTNSAFLDANGDDSTIGRLGLQNTLAESGPGVANTQREINGLDSYTGRTQGDVFDSLPAWTNNDVGASTDSLKTRADLLTQKFNASAGHTHSGVAGDAPPIPSANVSQVQLKGVIVSGTDLTSVTGTSYDISSLMTGLTASSGVTVKGVVVDTPYNQVPLKDSNGDQLVKPSAPDAGAVIYGRITKSGAVWTLSFYYLASGTETAISLTATYVKWYYQTLINPLTDAGFNYSDQLFVPSENATADVIYATSSVAGKVLLSSTSPSDVAATAAIGSSSAVALADHAHKGLHSLTPTGGTAIYGDATLTAGTGITLTQLGGAITINSTGATIGAQDDFGYGNGSNTSFGPLSFVPTNNAGVTVYLDGVYQEPSLWSVSGSSIVFVTAPAAGQKVNVDYLTQGIITIPPAPSGTVHVEYYTLSSTDATNKYVTLANTPASPSNVMIDIIGGCAQIFNVDFTIVSNEFRWSGYALDGVLATGDKFRIWYQT